LPRAYKNGNDLEAREKMHYAADMAGMAFSNSQIGIAHALGHALGAIFHIPHGRSVGLFLPYSIQYNWKYASDRYNKLAEKAGLNLRLDQAVLNLLKEIEQPFTIKQLNISKNDYDKRLDMLVSRAMESTAIIVNPRPVDEKECKKLFEYAYEGLPIDF
jgi:alcohol dehydrogenase class IV